MKEHIKITVVLVVLYLLSYSFASNLFANVTVLTPTDMTGLRNDYYRGVLDFSAVKQIDRTIIHYNISNIREPISQATLNIPVADWNNDGPVDSLALYAFYGDGIVSFDEWDSGTLAHVFTGIGGYPNTQTLQLDVTTLLQDAVNQQVPFLSFNCRIYVPTDSYFLGSIVGLPYPTLTIVPEPASAMLFGIGMVLFKLRRKLR